ncbi:MAG: glucose-6-phosphate isomerase, partial [Sediminibacterium sp.]|nr:glucose-6-phosphate isomerase [Sediminibacterium sp.]
FDYSKNKIDQQLKNLLIDLANEMQLSNAIKSQFNGTKINETEGRAVLHTALRSNDKHPIIVDGIDIIPQIENVLQKMKQFCNEIHTAKRLGYSNKKIKYIVNIGIGGSDLGPVMVTEALKSYWVDGIETFFVSNVDSTHITEVFKKINAAETLFLIASKTFTTQETMTNAFNARKWFLEQCDNNENYIATHFVALSTNAQAVQAFGIDLSNMFEFWDWVGGRYSLWSAIGLSIALTIGYENFEHLLAGAFYADEHFKNTDFENNIPVLMAFVGILNVNFWKLNMQAILPYSQYLHRFPAYLQQADMESNGKQIDRNGEKVNYHTGPIIFGEAGTNGQHAFYQLIHQGTSIIPCDFIGIVGSKEINESPILKDHQNKLVANCIAQTEALMNGKSIEEVNKENIAEMNMYKVFEGDRPTNTILLKKLNPYNLGQLIAFYEQKIFVQGVIWNIYSFDQYGVELGKQLANKVLPDLTKKEDTTTYNSSTNGLINFYKKGINE